MKSGKMQKDIFASLPGKVGWYLKMTHKTCRFDIDRQPLFGSLYSAVREYWNITSPPHAFPAILGKCAQHTHKNISNRHAPMPLSGLFARFCDLESFYK
jgi:hypothetical protein